MSQPILNMTVNATEFNKAAAALFKKSSRTYPEFVNGQLFGLAIQALNNTDKASKGGIRAELGTGKDSFAARIINSRLKKAGRPMIWGPDLNRAVSRMVAARVRATSFIKSGWLVAVMVLSKFIKRGKGRRDRDAKIRGKPKGSVRQAVPMLTGVVSGTITNTAIRDLQALEIAERGLRTALRIQTADMLGELQRRIQKDIDSVK